MVKVIENEELDESSKRISYILLEDGTVFKGDSFGASRETEGEIGIYLFKLIFCLYIYIHIYINLIVFLFYIVFSTGMTGYVESLTDPSYENQILVLTYPLIGNYGVPKQTKDELDLLKFFESDKIHASGLVVGNYCENYSHWNAEKSLSQWLIESDIPAISGIDTRKLTKILREKGSMLAKVSLHRHYHHLFLKCYIYN